MQRISEQPRMIIRVVQMRCEVYSSFGELFCILNHSSIHISRYSRDAKRELPNEHDSFIISSMG